ncbi:MAG: TatD family hydrolase, partial [Spirochaetaceae bacterium]|nr:TatD family hydrolase [Spirochaetaceae bacterium]
MFSDTHFHLLHLAERGIDLAPVFQELAERNTAFVLDIGTQTDDLPHRIRLAGDAISRINDDTLRRGILQALRFSAGIWPHPDAIRGRASLVPELMRHIQQVPGVAAMGECGLDHHWNTNGADGRTPEDFTADLLHGEAEMFEMLLEAARKLALPVIVHSREAFDGTLSCIRNVGYDCGVIHCFSYGVEEARSFLDRGWYISFTGAITYTKKTQMDGMKHLLDFVPRDRILLETDAPYLAPVPFRGTVNTPLLVEHVYRYAAGLMETTPDALSALVDA